jgi:hypothetical protein
MCDKNNSSLGIVTDNGLLFSCGCGALARERFIHAFTNRPGGFAVPVGTLVSYPTHLQDISVYAKYPGYLLVSFQTRSDVVTHDLPLFLLGGVDLLYESD